jgi:hypothetical protein
VQVAGQERVTAIADEDLDRENEEKTSSVHFLRFELTPPMRQALRKGAAITVGVDHPHYSATTQLGADVQAALAADLA